MDWKWQTAYNKGKTVLYSGHEEHVHGVSMVLSKEAENPSSGCNLSAITSSQPVSSLDMQSDSHAGTCSGQGSRGVWTKNKFYNLQGAIGKLLSYDIKLLLVDMNAQITNDRQGMEYIVGPYGTARRINYSGECLLQICNENTLCIGNTFSAHKSYTQEDFPIPRWWNKRMKLTTYVWVKDESQH